MRIWIVVFCALLGTFANAQRSDASVIRHFVGGSAPGQFRDVSTLLDIVGIGSTNVASETTATSFFVPGPSGSLVDLTFTFRRDTGSFLFSFGFFDKSAVAGINPVTQKQAWATAALASAVEVFDDRNTNPGAMTTINGVSAGSELIFYLIPNNTLDFFNNNQGLFYPSNFNTRAPLFSETAANPGELDQMLSFVDDDVTLFTFEDLTRTGVSDQDFTDLAFTVDASLIPNNQVPEPSTIAIWAGLGAIGLVGIRRAKRRKA